jgi:hypothetical protein
MANEKIDVLWLIGGLVKLFGRKMIEREWVSVSVEDDR